MKATDLMVGDWVICNYYSDKPVYMQFGVGDFQKLGFEFCDPIPLTPEILEKNRFIKSEEDPILMGGIGCAIIYGGYKRLDEDKFLHYGDNIYPIKYVHQLQHALRLCGIDKTIEL